MAAVFLATPVDVSLGTTGAWTDIDISGQTGYTSSVVGVLVEVINTGTANRAVGLRKNGSTDNRITNITGDTNGKHYVAAIGVDGSGIFEGYIANADTDFWLVGFLFSGDAAFFTNAVDKSTGSTLAWVDMDISGDTGGDTAIGAYIEMSAAGTRNTSLRKNGSTDDRRNVVTGQHDWMYCGVDGSEILEQWISVNDADNYLVGYQITGATFHTNATDRSTATTGAYEDVAALPSGAVGGIYEIYNTSGAAGRYNLRTKGGTDDRYYNVNRHAWFIVGVDSSQLCEQKIVNTGIDVFELGYYEGGTPAVIPEGKAHYDRPALRPSAPIAALTIAATLLSSTLAPAAPSLPDGRASVSIPVLAEVVLRGMVDGGRLTTTLAPPEPIPPGAASTTLPASRRPSPPTLDGTSRVLVFPVEAVQPPGKASEFRPPARRPVSIVTISTVPVTPDGVPEIRPPDWTPPRPRPRLNVSWTQDARRDVVAPQEPVGEQSWSLPDRRRLAPPPVTGGLTAPVLIRATKPPVPTAWPLPAPRRRAMAFTQDAWIARTTPPPVIPAGKAATDLPRPRRRAPVERWTYYLSPGLGPPPPDYVCIHVAVTALWPSASVLVESPGVTVVNSWPSVTADWDC